MSVWTIPLGAAIVLLIVGLPLVVWQVGRAVTVGSTEVEVLGIKVKSPYVGIVLVIVGIGFLWLSTQKLAEENQLKVVDAQVSIDGRAGTLALERTARCPLVIEVTGVISATGRGTVTYEFIRKEELDGVEQPSRHFTVDFDSAKSVTVTDEVVVGFPEGTAYYQDVLHVVGPTERRSDPVGFRVTCDPNAATPPPGMPPPPSIGVPP